MTPTNQNSNSRPNSLQAGIKSPLRKRLYINIYRYIIYPTLFTSKGEISVLVQMSCCRGCAGLFCCVGQEVRERQTALTSHEKQAEEPPVISVAFSDRHRAAGSKSVNRKSSVPSCLNHRGPVMALQKHSVPGPFCDPEKSPDKKYCSPHAGVTVKQCLESRHPSASFLSVGPLSSSHMSQQTCSVQL